MSEEYKCDVCGAPATVHLTQIVDGKIHKVHLCEKCAAKGKVAELPILKLTEMLAKTLAAGGKKASQEMATTESVGREPRKICEVCGFTDVVFEKKHWLGCPHCYDVFAEEIAALTPKIQRGRDYRGSGNANAKKTQSAPVTPSFSAEEIQVRLKAAVAKEDYALAARLRDQLRAITVSESKKLASRNVAEKTPPKKKSSTSRSRKSATGKKSGGKKSSGGNAA